MRRWPCVTIAAGCLVAAVLLGTVAARAADSTTTADAPYVTSDARVPAGDHVLATRLYRPVGREHYPVVLLSFGSGNESMLGGAYARYLATVFAQRGIATLAYDKRGTGTSTGHATGTDFVGLGRDAAAVARFARKLPHVENVGVWGISQFGWVAPTLVRDCPELCFAILVSPAGVDPFEQIAWFLRGQLRSWGLTPEETDAADRMHRAVTLYYAGRSSWKAAQAEVDRHVAAPWFHRVVTHPYWDEMTPEGRILTPDSLATALKRRPSDFEIYRAPSTFADYARDYRVLRSLPTFVIYGGADQLVPVDRSRPLFEAALRGEKQHAHEFRTFDGASHDIQTPEGHVLPEYLTAIADWAHIEFLRAR